MRRGSGVRLPADAAPRGDRRGADRPADASPGPRPRRRWRRPALLDRAARAFDVEPGRGSRTSSSRAFEAAGLARGGDGRFGLWTRHGRCAPDARGARRSARPCPPGGDALRGLDVTLLGVALERLPASTPTRWRRGARRLHEVGGEAVDAVDAGRRRCGVPAGGHAGRGDRGRRPRRRRHAPEIDLLLPQGPDRPRHQPARMPVNRCPIRSPSRSCRAPRSRPSTAGPSARTRSSCMTAASTSSRGCPSADRGASRCCSSTASSPARGLWERYLGYFAGRGWEGHALNLRNHYWSQTADPADALVRHLRRGRRRRAGPPRADDRRRRPRDGRPAGAEGRRARRDLGPRAHQPGAAARPPRRRAPTSCARSRRSTGGA